MENGDHDFEPIVFPEYILTPSGYVQLDEDYRAVVSEELQDIESRLLGYDEASAALGRVARLWGKQRPPESEQLIEK